MRPQVNVPVIAGGSVAALHWVIAARQADQRYYGPEVYELICEDFRTVIDDADRLDQLYPGWREWLDAEPPIAARRVGDDVTLPWDVYVLACHVHTPRGFRGRKARVLQQGSTLRIVYVQMRGSPILTIFGLQDQSGYRYYVSVGQLTDQAHPARSRGRRGGYD